MDREYGIETRIPFTLYEADGINLRTDAVYVAGDVKISKDEGSPQDTDNGFVAVNGKYYITLTATEMQATRISLKIVDQDATKLWLDIAPSIETYGNASAQHAFNRNSADVTTDTVSRDGSKADISGVATQVSVDDIPNNAEFEARTIVAATYALDSTVAKEATKFNPSSDVVARVTLVDTTTANTDMRGTDSALTDKADFSLSAAGIDAILDETIGDGTITMREALRVSVASFASKVSGGGTTTIIYRNNADTQNVIEMTVDSTGNRTAVTLTP